MNVRLENVLLAGFFYSGASLLGACSDDDDGGTEADRWLVGAECSRNDQCLQSEGDGIQQDCLTEFKGGYCGLKDCASNADCPSGSACVTHDNGTNYCFRQCVEKVDCNRNRTKANESSCVSSVTFVDPGTAGKACEPPSSGT